MLSDCFKEGSKTKAKKLNQLDGLELLEKLKRHVYDQTTHQTNNLPSYNDKETNIDQIKSHLVVCNNLLKRNQSGILKIVVVYGQWLNKLKSLHFGRFKSICTETLQITPSWCHKLCKESTLFKRFPKLQELSLSITEASQLVKKNRLCSPITTRRARILELLDPSSSECLTRHLLSNQSDGVRSVSKDSKRGDYKQWSTMYSRRLARKNFENKIFRT